MSITRSTFLPLSCLAAALLSGCGDQATTPVAVEASAALAPSPDPERAALDVLTRAVAMTLRNEGLRRRVHNDLRNSRWTVEHKLPFKQYLHGESGGILMAGMSASSGISRDSLRMLLATTRALEFYMPVPRHREEWTGDRNLIVASLIQDHTVPSGYDLYGSPVSLSAETAPGIPTLAIVPMETGFQRALPTSRFVNAGDRGGNSIGTFELTMVEQEACTYPADGTIVGEDGTIVQPCESESGSYGPAPSPPKGLYYTAAALRGVGEAWIKGQPEIEVHPIHGYDRDKPWGPGDGYSECTAGESKSGYRHFNQDSERWTGNVLVLDSAQAARYYVPSGEPRDAVKVLAVSLFEDDYNECILHTNIDMENELANLLIGGVGMYMILGPAAFGTPSLGSKLLLATGFSYFPLRGAWWVFHTNDDYLGVATFRHTVTNPGYEGYSHIMFREDGARNGAINLVYRN